MANYPEDEKTVDGLMCPKCGSQNCIKVRSTKNKATWPDKAFCLCCYYKDYTHNFADSRSEVEKQEDYHGY